MFRNNNMQVCTGIVSFLKSIPAQKNRTRQKHVFLKQIFDSKDYAERGSRRAETGGVILYSQKKAPNNLGPLENTFVPKVSVKD